MMKFFPILFFFITTSLNGQDIIERVNLSCYPPNGAEFILLGSDTSNQWSLYKGESIGSGYSFIADSRIKSNQGFFLKGDLFSSRGGKINIAQNGYSKKIYVYANEWSCVVNDKPHDAASEIRPITVNEENDRTKGCPSNVFVITAKDLNVTARRYRANDGHFYYQVTISVIIPESQKKYFKGITYSSTSDGRKYSTKVGTNAVFNGIAANSKSNFIVIGDYSCIYNRFLMVASILFSDLKFIN